MITDLGHWETALSFDVLPFGFIYIITNKLSGRKYIGKKQISKIRKLKPLKGTKKKRKSAGESDWKKYTSSSTELNEDIVKHGMSNFKFEIVKLCSSKWELSYSESKMQFENNVLLTDAWYNAMIHCRIGKVPKALYNALNDRITEK